MRFYSLLVFVIVLSLVVTSCFCTTISPRSLFGEEKNDLQCSIVPFSNLQFPVNNSGIASTAVGDTIFFAGGIGKRDNNGFSNQVNILNSASTSWDSTTMWNSTAMEKGRAKVTMASINDLVMIMGGLPSGKTSLLIEIYNTSSGSWNPSYELWSAKDNIRSTVCKEYVFILGDSPDIDIFNVRTFEILPRNFSRIVVSVESIEELVLFAGGVDSSDQISNKIDIFNVSIFDWQTTTSILSTPRAMMTTTKVNTKNIKKVFFAGGLVSSMNSLVVSDLIDIFDYPHGNMSTSHLSVARRLMGAGSIGEIVFFAGGTVLNFHSSEISAFMDGVDTLDIFNASSLVSYYSHLSSPRSSVSAVSTGKYLFFVGGSKDNITSSSQIDVLSCTKCSQGYYSKSGYEPCYLSQGGYYTNGTHISP